MKAPAPITITPVRVADLLVAEVERMPVHVHVIAHPVRACFDHGGGNHLFAGRPIYV